VTGEAGGARPPYAAVVLAGGRARRMGGRPKPALDVGGRTILDRVLAAVADAYPRVVVGPPELDLPDGVARTREDPPGGGPVAALVSGLAVLGGASAPPFVAVLAGDLPMLDAAAVVRLRAAARAPGADVAVYTDADARPQLLCAVWRTAALRARCAALGGAPHGRAVRDLVSGAVLVTVSAPAEQPPPWFDCDTEDDLDRARRFFATGDGTGDR
jgi:molybdopterin-guanine dinucleotide biosynthesis protein A